MTHPLTRSPQILKNLATTFLAFSSLCSAQEVVLTSAKRFGAGDDQGNWIAQSFQLNSANLHTTGAKPVTPVRLNSISFIRGKGATDPTPSGPLKLALLTKNRQLDSLVATSHSAVNVKETPPGGQITFQFEENVTLDPNVIYFATPFRSIGNSGPTLDTLATFRVKCLNLKQEGGAYGNHYLTKPYDNDLDFRISVNPLKEFKPQTLLSFGNISVSLDEAPKE